MNITGKLFEIHASQQVSEAFRKRTFIVEYAENIQYPEYLSFELIQDKCDLLEGFHEGEEVTIHFNLRGRKWTNPEGIVRYFNSLQAWRLEKGNKLNELPTSNPPFMEEEDGLPF